MPKIEKPLPFWIHRCTPHVSGLASETLFVSRCRCGGILIFGQWVEKNSFRADRLGCRIRGLFKGKGGPRAEQ